MVEGVSGESRRENLKLKGIGRSRDRLQGRASQVLFVG